MPFDFSKAHITAPDGTVFQSLDAEGNVDEAHTAVAYWDHVEATSSERKPTSIAKLSGDSEKLAAAKFEPGHPEIVACECLAEECAARAALFAECKAEAEADPDLSGKRLYAAKLARDEAAEAAVRDQAAVAKR